MKQFPLFLRWHDCGEVEKFDSLSDLAINVEPIDVENREFEAWDSEGHPLLIDIVKGDIRISTKTDQNSLSLQEALANFAASLGIERSQIENRDAIESFGKIELHVTKTEKPNLIQRLFGRRK